jgi:HSP20 family protein
MTTTTTRSVEEQATPETAPAERTRSGRTYSPPVDIQETEDELVLVADMPGVKPGDIDVRFEGGELSISGKVEWRYPEGASFLFCEYGTEDFQRTFAVSEEVDSSRITAEYKDGVLTLHLPKAEEAKQRKIAVAAK